MAKDAKRGKRGAAAPPARATAGPVLAGLTVVTGLLVGAAVVYLTDFASRTETLFKGNGALALLFSLGPAGVAAMWVGIVAWWSGTGNWGWRALATLALGSAAAMFANLTPYLLSLSGLGLQASFYLGTVATYPAIGFVAGLLLAALLARLTRRAFVAAVVTALLGVAVGVGLMAYFFLLSPLLLGFAFALPPALALAARGRGPGRPSAAWLWASLALAAVAVVAAVLFAPR